MSADRWSQLVTSRVREKQRETAGRIPRSPAAVWKAIKAFRTQELMADALGVEQSTISAWGSGDRPVPTQHCPAIEKKTKAIAKAKQDPSLIVMCEELRPDIDWAALRTA